MPVPITITNTCTRSETQSHVHRQTGEQLWPEHQLLPLRCPPAHSHLRRDCCCCCCRSAAPAAVVKTPERIFNLFLHNTNFPNMTSRYKLMIIFYLNLNNSLHLSRFSSSQINALSRVYFGLIFMERAIRLSEMEFFYLFKRVSRSNFNLKGYTNYGIPGKLPLLSLILVLVSLFYVEFIKLIDWPHQRLSFIYLLCPSFLTYQNILYFYAVYFLFVADCCTREKMHTCPKNFTLWGE